MMKKMIFLILFTLVLGCEKKEKKEKESLEPMKTSGSTDIEKLSEELKTRGYETFLMKQGDSAVLMQQYFVVFLNKGKNRAQDSLQAVKLQEQHMEHLNRMYKEGYTSLTGPMGDDGELRGIVVYNTATQKEADSLANLDPMVQAGRLEVQVHPWWAAKGGKLN